MKIPKIMLKLQAKFSHLFDKFLPKFQVQFPYIGTLAFDELRW